MAAPDRTVVRFELAPATIVWLLVAVASVWLLRELWGVALLAVVALVLAGTFIPIVQWMEKRGLSRSRALAVLFVGLIVTGSIVVFLTVPPLLLQLAEMAATAPQHRDTIIAALEGRALTAPLAQIVRDADLDQLSAQIGNYLLNSSSQLLLSFGYGVTTLVLSFYFLTDGKRVQGIVYAVVPRDYHMRLARILYNLQTIVGGYMRGQVITSVAMGSFTLVALLIAGVPNALPLAVLAALADVIPFAGGILATAPIVVSALPLGVPTVGVLLVAMFSYMEFSNRILVPRVYGHVLRLSPVAVVLALLAGGALLGVVGALLALPIAAGLQMILEELRVELPGDDSDDRGARARNAKTEAIYERMSAGSTAPEAGQIAADLAHELRDADAAAAAEAKGAGT